MSERPHRRLILWQKSISLTKSIYAMTARFPGGERYGLVSQMRRASVSIASNIAEGAARYSNAEKLHFFHIARGSLSELDTQLEISDHLSFVPGDEQLLVQQQIDEVGRLLQGLIASRKTQS